MPKRSLAARPASQPVRDRSFDEVLALIDAAKRRAFRAVNTELVGLYWDVGGYISRKIASAEWGDGVVEELASAIARRHPSIRGFARPNLFRMRQFYDAYVADEKVSPLVRLLPWTHHMLILNRTKVREERGGRPDGPTRVDPSSRRPLADARSGAERDPRRDARIVSEAGAESNRLRGPAAKVV